MHLCRPFQDFAVDQRYEILNFYSHSLLNVSLGFRAVYQNNWIAGQWPKNFLVQCKPSIEFLELYALTMALMV